MVALAEFRPASATADEWRRYHAFRRARHAEWRPEDPLAPDDVVEAQLRAPDTAHLWHAWGALEGDELVGWVAAVTIHPTSPEYETNRHLAWLDAGHVLEAHRRRGVGRLLAGALAARMAELGVTTITAPGEREAGHAFLRWLGAEPRMRERSSRLDLGQVDWAEMDRWIRDGEERSPGARLELHQGRLPEGLLAEYASATSEIMNTMPFEDLDHGAIVSTPEQIREQYAEWDQTGTLNHVAIVRDAGGAIAGTTDVIKHAYEPGLVHQNFTGVHPRARGRGVGRWLKAAMLRQVRELHPDTVTIETENAGSNRWMLGINEAMGFRPERAITWYQVTLDRMREALSG